MFCIYNRCYETSILLRVLPPTCSPQHSFGFITCCERNESIFFHFSQYNGNTAELRPGGTSPMCDLMHLGTNFLSFHLCTCTPSTLHHSPPCDSSTNAYTHPSLPSLLPLCDTHTHTHIQNTSTTPPPPPHTHNTHTLLSFYTHPTTHHYLPFLHFTNR